MSYVSLYNETTGDFDTINIGIANINNATIDTVTATNATITTENVENSTINFLEIGNKLSLPDGTNLNPSLTFINDSELGFYRSALGEITFVYNGIPIFRLNTSQTTLFNNLFAPNRIILDEFTGSAASPTLQFFDIGLGIFRSNLGVLSISSQGFQIIDIDDLKLKVNGAIEANSATIGTLSIGGLNVNNLTVTGTSSFGNTITCTAINSSSTITASSSIIGNGGFISRLGSGLLSSYGFAGLPTTYIYATVFPSIDIQVGGSGCMEFIPTQISVFKNLVCGTNSISCGQITSTSSVTANGGVISRLGNNITSSYGFSGLANTFIYGTANPNIVVQVAGTANIDTGVGYVNITQPLNVINQSITCASINGTSSSTINLLTCTTANLTNMNCTTSSITNLTCTTANITNLTCTTSNTTNLVCTSGTVSNLTSTTITNSGTMSSGNTTINGTLRTTSSCRIATNSPNLNSTNNLDVYGFNGMSTATHNTFYGVNAYFSGGWRPITNGYSCIFKLDLSGSIYIVQSATSNTADALMSNFNNSAIFSPNNDVQFFGNLNTPSLSLSAQPMLVREMTTTQTITTGLNTTITSWTNVIVNQGTGISYSAGVFTFTTAGTYSISYQVQFDPNVTGVRESWVLHTARTYAGVTTNASSRRSLLSGSCVIKCAASDSVQLEVYQNSGGNLNVDPTADRCTFTILRLN